MPKLGELSARENEVAKLITRGYSNQKIANRLGIAIGTVKIHVHQILLKAGKRSRLELAVATLKKPKPRKRAPLGNPVGAAVV